MLLLNSTLKCTEQPSLEQRGDVMDARHKFVSVFRAGADHCYLVWISRLFKTVIAPPSIGMNCRARLYSLSNKTKQTFCGNIFDVL